MPNIKVHLTNPFRDGGTKITNSASSQTFNAVDMLLNGGKKSNY